MVSDKKMKQHAKYKVTICFDGSSGNDSQLHPTTRFGIKVLFSRGMSADDLIINIVNQNSDVENIYVVTDDRAVRAASITAGAKVVKVKDFMGFKEKKPRRKKASDERSELSSKEKDMITSIAPTGLLN